MILRIYRARTATADHGLLLEHIRDHVYPANVLMSGLRTFQAGLRTVDERHIDLVLVTTWSDYESMVNGIGRDVLRPRWLDAVGNQLVPTSADHYELVGEELRGIVPLASGALGVFTGRLGAGGEVFFDDARRAQAEDLESGGIIASHLGRRLDEHGEEAAYVVVRADGERPGTHGGWPTEFASVTWDSYFSSHALETYNAIAQAPARPGSDHALLLADDDRRYVFASPAAARLLGRPAARILGRRIEDVTAPTISDRLDELWRSFVEIGSQTADYALTRPDGSVVAVHYEARANTPWRGVHASVLSVSAEPVDLDAALAGSGIVARYDVAETV